jgi:hypothetical protein
MEGTENMGGNKTKMGIFKIRYGYQMLPKSLFKTGEQRNLEEDRQVVQTMSVFMYANTATDWYTAI